MKTHQCPACGHKLGLKQTAVKRTVNRKLLLQCVNCSQWSHENRKAAVAKNLGLILLLAGSIMGYFQFGGIITGPLLGFGGALLALIVGVVVPRTKYNS